MAILITSQTPADSLPLKGKKSALVRRYKKLETDRSSWRTHWMEITDYILPRRGRYILEAQGTKGRKRSSKIIDSTATKAVRTLAAGLMSGMTSPARPWHRRRVKDEKLMQRADVRAWLDQVEKIERSILHKSNFYNIVHTLYTELGCFGTAPLYRQPHRTNAIWFRPYTAGEYVIAENELGMVDTLGRHFTMSVQQVVKKFVYQRETDSMDWEVASAAVKRSWDKGNYDNLVPIVHMIQPRLEAEQQKLDNKNMPFSSCYFELNGERDKLLRESGYQTFPAYVPRWDVLGGEVYGTSPGMDTLGDVKQLQHQHKRKAQALDKHVNPPMVAPNSLKGKPSTVLPGQTTYVDPQQGGQGFVPAYQVQPRLQEFMMDIQETQQRIQSGFYADLFAMMIESNRRQITATEVVERHEEKLVLLGPVLQRLNVELLDPLLDDVFEFALEAGLLPDPPAALHEQEVEVEYISLLAQAQQAVAATAIERSMGFAGNLVAAIPDILDNVDADDAWRKYSEIVGAPATMIVDPKLVEKKRAQRNKQQQEQAAVMEGEQIAGAGAQAAQAAKVLSETDVRSPNALTEMLSGL